MSESDKIDRRRARAHALRSEGLSLNAIAKRLGCGKATVARDLAEPAPEIVPVPNLQRADGSPVAGVEPGERRALTHGCYSPATLSPRAEEVAGDLREALGPAYGDHVAPMVWLAAMAIARLEAAQRDLDAFGLVDETGELRPLAKSVGSFQAEARRSLADLALTPREWTKLGLDNLRGGALERHLREKYGGGS